MEKGLRQGDPHAPFLFLIVAEGLGGFMREACRKGLFKRAEVKSHELHI